MKIILHDNDDDVTMLLAKACTILVFILTMFLLTVSVVDDISFVELE